MTSITYIGMDVHTTNFTLCCYSFEDDKVYATVQVKPEYTQIHVCIDDTHKTVKFLEAEDKGQSRFRHRLPYSSQSFPE